MKRVLVHAVACCIVTPLIAAPKVVLISLDGATPRLVDKYTRSGALPPDTGLRLLESKGVKALQNTTINPSLTAVAHVAIATGSTAAHNDIPANSFHTVASPFSAFNISGFGAPIGGYEIGDGNGHPSQSAEVTAEPLWIALRNAGKVVATATWPGGDGVDVKLPGFTGVTGPVVQPAAERTVDYTVPFGASTSPFQKGFPLTAANFSNAPAETVNQLNAAGRPSFSAVKQTNLETFTSAGVGYDIKVAVLDSTNDSAVNYDTVVFFNQAQGIQPGPFSLPSTGPAYVHPAAAISALFYLEGHPNKGGVRYFVSRLEPDLAVVRLARSSVSFIPRNAAVLGDVDDVNFNVGFWQPQPDFRIVERIDATPSTFATFPDTELEAIYGELVREFPKYQSRVGLRAISRFPDADLVMIYIEQPDGSGHQFFLTDPRQPTDFTNPNSIGVGQDASKVARYNALLEAAYVTANNAVQSVIDAVGVDANGVPKSNIFVVSDHGFDTFHTAVTLLPILTNAGIDTSKVKIVTSGSAANIYINLQGREQGGVASRYEYLDLQRNIVKALKNFADVNPNYTQGAASVPVFDKVYARPNPWSMNDATFGRRVSDVVGQDSGDVFALLTPGYNFDGRQNPAVTRLRDATNAILSLPNFYGVHGYDPARPEMSAIFYAAGPNVTQAAPLSQVSNTDMAPTIMRILGVPPAATVDGNALPLGPAPLTLLKAVSCKPHGSAGDKDIVLPLSGPIGIEDRNPGATGTHSLIFTFSNDIASGSATFSGFGTAGDPVIFRNTIAVPLTGVSDVQSASVTLTGITDTAGNHLPSTTVKIAFLKGDVNGDLIVDDADVAEVKSQASGLAALENSNIRSDATINGVINSADIAFTKANLGHTLQTFDNP
ncbi:MAG TPA: alkaline phosphatase family protein [Chthoniobacterales bacterium]